MRPPSPLKWQIPFLLLPLCTNLQCYPKCLCKIDKVETYAKNAPTKDVLCFKESRKGATSPCFPKTWWFRPCWPYIFWIQSSRLITRTHWTLAGTTIYKICKIWWTTTNLQNLKKKDGNKVNFQKRFIQEDYVKRNLPCLTCLGWSFEPMNWLVSKLDPNISLITRDDIFHGRTKG